MCLARDLLDRGHRRIAFIGDRAYIHNIRERLRAFRAAHERAGIGLDDRLIVMDSHTADSAQAVVSGLLDRIDGATDPPQRVVVPVAVRRLRPPAAGRPSR